MSKADQRWDMAQLGGFTVEECPLWQSTEPPYAGLFRLPKGFQFPHHSHSTWVQLLVLEGAILLEVDGLEPFTAKAGDYYFVEPGDPHTETVVEDLVAFVTTAEDRMALYESFGPLPI